MPRWRSTASRHSGTIRPSPWISSSTQETVQRTVRLPSGTWHRIQPRTRSSSSRATLVGANSLLLVATGVEKLGPERLAARCAKVELPAHRGGHLGPADDAIAVGLTRAGQPGRCQRMVTSVRQTSWRTAGRDQPLRMSSPARAWSSSHTVVKWLMTRVPAARQAAAMASSRADFGSLVAVQRIGVVGDQLRLAVLDQPCEGETCRFAAALGDDDLQMTLARFPQEMAIGRVGEMGDGGRLMARDATDAGHGVL